MEQTMKYVRALGYDALEIAPFTVARDVTAISSVARSEIRKLALDNGLDLSAIHWVLVETEGLHLTHPDRAVRQRTADYFCHLVDFAADIGASTMVVGSPKQRNVLDGVTTQDAWRFAREVFQPATRLAENRSVTICLEPLAPSETNFINTAAEARQFATEAGSAHFKIILDVKAMCSEALGIPEIIAASQGSFTYFHANDRNLKGPGFGEVDFKPIARALKGVDYNGYVSVEVFKFEEGPETIASKSIAYLKECFKP
jgi:sugar phosphate isomerase/epimerase